MPDFNCGCDASKELPQAQAALRRAWAVLDAYPMSKRTLSVQALIQQIRAAIENRGYDQ